MNTEALIHELALQCAPVKPMAPPLRRFLRWMAGAIACLIVGVAVLGFRGDLAAVLPSAGFVVHGLLLLGLTAVSALAAFTSSVPGEKRWTWLSMAALAAWLLFIVGLVGMGWGGEAAGVGLKCIRNLLLLSAPPGLLLYFMLRRAAPLEAGGVGFLAALSASALANLGTRFLCHHDGGLHTLAWHYLPLLALSAAGILLGRLSFR